MTNEELTKIREDRKETKSEFAKLLGITPMMMGRYESGKIKIPDAIAEKAKELSDAATATEIEVKKTVRKAARTTKKAVKDAVEDAAQSDAAVANEIEVKKTVRKAGRKAKKTVEEAAAIAEEAVKEAVGIPNIVVQSPMGGYISIEDIIKKTPEGATDIYIRVDENKLYYVLKNGETGDVDIW